ncbi:MAG: DUF2007 domain-containing protein [Robiginitomaculum sp.]|nr:DUF2007 domain-containing protein [Robiginitomaculum sp.]
MIAIIKTNNPVTLNFAGAVLKSADIAYFIADTHASILDGSIGAIPRRVLVLEDDEMDARAALSGAGLEKELWTQ